jgi:hypothetical protein
MPSYIEETKEIEVPPASGIPGYLKIIESVLERPRIQEVVLAKGRITYRRFRREDEPSEVSDIEFDDIMPAAVIRNSQLEELKLLSDNAAVAVSQLFTKAHMDGVNPIALVGGGKSLFFPWHTKTTSVVLAQQECYGLPFLSTPAIPDEALILCAAYERRAHLPATVRSYKITIPLIRKTKP